MEEINFRQLCKNLKKRGYEPAEKGVSDFVEEYEKIVFSVEPKNMRLKDIVNKMKDLSDHTRAVWIDGILREFGNGFGSEKWREGYEQGKFEGEFVGQQLKDADKIRRELNRPVVKQFVADWFEKCKEDLEYNIWDWIKHKDELEKTENMQFIQWLHNCDNEPVKTLVKMKLYGYKIEKEKRYIVKVKNVLAGSSCLIHGTADRWYYGHYYDSRRGVHHTRKELEDAGFGEVFNSPLFEVEEVKG